MSVAVLRAIVVGTDGSAPAEHAVQRAALVAAESMHGCEGAPAEALLDVADRVGAA